MKVSHYIKSIAILVVVGMVSAFKLKAQEVINNNRKTIVMESLRNVKDYLEGLKSDNDPAYEYKNIKVDTVIETGNSVVVMLTEKERGWVHVGTDLQTYNSLLKGAGYDAESTSVYMLVIGTVTPKYASSKVPPIRMYDVKNYGDLKWKLVLTSIDSKETQGVFSFESMEPQHRKQFLDTFSLKDDEFFSYKLKKINITNKFSDLVLNFIKEQKKNDYPPLRPNSAPPAPEMLPHQKR